MSRVHVSDDWKERVARVRQSFADSGTNISQWSRDRGFSPRLVAGILRGDRLCVRGHSHRIAVALGLKADAEAPGAPIEAARGMEPSR